MKQFEVLYINGQLVNIGTTDITLEWKSVMFSNISKFKASHSYTIKLPMTANNRKVFGMAEDAAHDDHAFANNLTTAIGRRMSARYYCNGVDLLGDANAYLIGTEKDFYKVVLTWGSMSMIQSIIDETRTLPEIFGGEDDNPTMIEWERWSGGRIRDDLGDNVLCLAYQNGVVGDEMMGYTYYLPSFKVTWLMDKIFRKYGVKYDMSRPYKRLDGTVDTYTEMLLDDLYIPMTTWKDSPYIQKRNYGRWQITRAELGEEHTNLYGDTPAYMDRIFWMFPVNESSPVLGWAGVYQNMKYRIKVHIRVFISRPDSGWSEASVVGNMKLAIVNGNTKESASKLLSLTATSVRRVPEDLLDLWGVGFYEVKYEYTDGWEEVEGNDTPGDDSWKGEHSGEGVWDDVIEIRQGRRLWIDGYGRDVWLGTESGFNDIVTQLRGFGYNVEIEPYDNYIEIVPIMTTPLPWHENFVGISANAEEKSPLYLEPNFPDMKPIEFLKGIFYLIGAYPVIVGDTLKICLYRDIADNARQAKDWSRFVVGDYDQPESIDFSMSDWSRRNWLRYKDDSEDNPMFGNFFEVDDEYLSDQEDVFTLPFQGSKTINGMAEIPIYEPGKVLNYTKYPNADYAFAEEIDGYVLKECKPRIGVRYSIGLGQGGTVQSTNMILVNLLRDTLVFEPLNFANEESTVWKRYEIFAKMLQHPYLISVTMELDEFTLAGLDMSIPVYLRQFSSYFGILSIKRKSDGQCTVKLIKIPNSLITI